MTSAALGQRHARLFDLTGKTAFVTGGGRGIGRGIVLALAAQGADVAIATVSRPDAARAVERSVLDAGRRALVVEMDVASRDEVERGVARVESELGEIDILVNNAGVLDFAPFLELTEQAWDRVLDVNLKGQFLVAQAVARRMVVRGRGGRIVNVASIGSGGVGVGFASIAHYAASKGGIIGLTETMAIELAPHGITVNAVAPGVIETDMTAGMLQGDEREALLRRIPLGRPGSPAEIGAAVAFLASDEASYCTGSTLYVDGGWLAE